jgi:hypothetical protein
MATSEVSARFTMAACIVVAAAMAGCASAPVGPPVDAPKFVVGDRWEYRVIDNLRRGAVAELDAEVVAAAGPSATIRITYADINGRSVWNDQVDDGGSLRAGTLWREPPRLFNPPVQLLAFPLDQAKTWRQVINTYRPDTELDAQILVYGRVEGRRATTVPGGAYDAVYVYRIVQLDDEEFWRTRTTLRDAVWYAPEVKAPARLAREAEYTEKSGGPDVTTVRTESSVLELVSFRPGAR